MGPEPQLPSISEEAIVEDDRSRRSSLEGPPRKQARQDFHCLLCDKHYKDSRSLRRHERENRDHLRFIGREPENIYQCHVADCGRSFPRESDLRRHKRERHDGQKRKVSRNAPISTEPVASDAPCPELSTSDSTPAGTVSSTSASSDEIADWKAEPRKSQHSFSAYGCSDSDSIQLNWSFGSIKSPLSQIDEPIEDNAATTEDEIQANSLENECLNESQELFPGPTLRNTYELPPPSEGHLDLLPGAQSDQQRDGMSTHGHIRMSVSCEPERHRSDTRLDDDNASISTVSSMFSFLSLEVPFRSGLSRADSRRNPRPQQLAFPRPCPICGKEFGVDIGAGLEVKAHLEFHLRAMQEEELMASCRTCQVSFVHLKDLEWHLNWSDKEGSCGFHAKTDECTGHHPPSDRRRLQQDHLNFARQLRSWEAVQLRDFVMYVSEYASGRVRTNAPRYGASPPLWCRSTGSLQSVRSLLSNRSAPMWIDYHSRSRFAIFELPSPQKRSLSRLGRSSERHLIRGAVGLKAYVRAGDVSGTRRLLNRIPKEVSLREVEGLIKSATARGHPGVLQLLVDFRNSGEGEAGRIGGIWYSDKLLLDSMTVWTKTYQERHGHCFSILLNGGVHFQAPNDRSSWGFSGFLRSSPGVNMAHDVLPRITNINSSAVQSLACMASYCGAERLLEDLLKAGFDVNNLRGKSHSSVEAAVRFGDCAKVDVLIRLGADFWSANEEGLNPADIAAQFGDFSMLYLLSQRLVERQSNIASIMLSQSLVQARETEMLAAGFI